jgi:hypothetical protein
MSDCCSSRGTRSREGEDVINGSPNENVLTICNGMNFSSIILTGTYIKALEKCCLVSLGNKNLNN